MVKKNGTSLIPVDDAPGRRLPAVPDEAPQYLRPEELPTPRFRIIQKQTEEHSAGVFVNNLTEEGVSFISCVILGMRRGRILWPKIGEGEDPLCRSRDQVYGEGAPGGECAGCTLRKWDEDETKSTSDRKPKCAETIDFAARGADGVPFFFQVSRSGLKPAIKFIAGVQYAGKPLYFREVEITLRQALKPVLHYVPVFKSGEETDAVKDWPIYAEILKYIKAAWDRTPAETSTAEADEGPAFV